MSAKQSDVLERLGEIGESLEGGNRVSLEDANFVRDVSKEYMTDEESVELYPSQNFSNESIFQSKAFKIGMLAVIAAIIAKILGMFGGGSGGGGGGGGGGSSSVPVAIKTLEEAKDRLQIAEEAVEAAPTLTASDKDKIKKKVKAKAKGEESDVEPESFSSPEASAYASAAAEAVVTLSFGETALNDLMDLSKNPSPEKLVKCYQASASEKHRFFRYRLLNDPSAIGVLGMDYDTALRETLSAFESVLETYEERINLLAGLRFDRPLTSNTDKYKAWTEYSDQHNLDRWFEDDYGPSFNENITLQPLLWPITRKLYESILGQKWDVSIHVPLNWGSQEGTDYRNSKVDEIVRDRTTQLKELLKPVPDNELNPMQVVKVLTEGPLIEFLKLADDSEKTISDCTGIVKKVDDWIARMESISKENAELYEEHLTVRVGGIIDKFISQVRNNISILRRTLMFIGLCIEGVLKIAHGFDKAFDPEKGLFIKIGKQINGVSQSSGASNESFSSRHHAKVWMNW